MSFRPAVSAPPAAGVGMAPVTHRAAPPATMKYRIEAKNQTTVDLTAFGQAPQEQTLGRLAERGEVDRGLVLGLDPVLHRGGCGGPVGHRGHRRTGRERGEYCGTERHGTLRWKLMAEPPASLAGRRGHGSGRKPSSVSCARAQEMVICLGWPSPATSSSLPAASG